MKEKVLQVLRDEYPDVDFTLSDTLVDDGILDSMLLTGVVAALTAEFKIVISYKEITEKNFNSVDAIANMVERLLER